MTRIIENLIPSPRLPKSSFFEHRHPIFLSICSPYSLNRTGSIPILNNINHLLVDVVGFHRKSRSIFAKNCFSVKTTVPSIQDFKSKVTSFPYAKHSRSQNRQLKSNPRDDKSRKPVKKAGKKDHHLWKKRDSARSGEKAQSLVRIVCELPDAKEVVYGALDKWTAWEAEFPLIAVAKALKTLRKHNQWLRVIQVAKWMLSKGQGTTMGTYDTLLLAFDMDNRVDEAQSLWNMILHTHARSISKQLFSRMISLYDHHNMPDGIVEIFADMEELGVRPDEDTVRRVVRAFKELGQEDKQMLVLKRYMYRWKYIHFKGERVRVRRNIPD